MNTLLLTLANMGVSLDDVADVVNNCIPQLIFFGVVVAAAIIVLIAMAVNKKLAKPTKFMVRTQSGLAVLLAFGIMLNLVAFGPMSTMLDLVTGNGTITEESGAEANALCTEIAEEGIVLLQNDDNELPLASGSNLNVFGWASVGPVYGGTGAGAISAARPGARRENLENYIKRLEQLEEITGSYPGVDKAYAIQAGREVRVMVKPEQVSEDQMVILARELAKKIEEEMEYPGQIKVHVLRETKAVDYAK